MSSLTKHQLEKLLWALLEQTLALPMDQEGHLTTSSQLRLTEQIFRLVRQLS